MSSTFAFTEAVYDVGIDAEAAQRRENVWCNTDSSHSQDLSPGFGH